MSIICCRHCLLQWWLYLCFSCSLQEPDLILQDDNGFGLFLGNFHHSTNVKVLQERGITWVLNVASEHVYENGFDPCEIYGDAFTYLGIAMDDVPGYYIAKHFSKTNDFVQRAHENCAKILVHCKAGRSRSVATVMAYLIGRCVV